MSSSKIKVDPRTFKIINQAQSKGPSQSQSQSQSQTTTDSFTSDSESSTSVNSDAESVKVIKLDNIEQSGGLAKSNGPSITGSEVRIQPSQDRIIKPAVPNPQQAAPLAKPEIVNPPTQSAPKVQNNSNNQNLFNYLSMNNTSQSNIGQETPLSKLEESIGVEDTDNTASTSKTAESQTNLAVEVQSAEQQVEDTSQDVFDLTQNKLYQVLSKLFEDTKGNNISENIEKLSKLFESHNQIMEKMLNQLIIMNTNYKQIKVPESVQTSTKQAGNIIDFRKKLDQMDQKEQKKP
jgi:hypothetical protein